VPTGMLNLLDSKFYSRHSWRGSSYFGGTTGMKTGTGFHVESYVKARAADNLKWRSAPHFFVFWNNATKWINGFLTPFLLHYSKVIIKCWKASIIDAILYINNMMKGGIDLFIEFSEKHCYLMEKGSMKSKLSVIPSFKMNSVNNYYYSSNSMRISLAWQQQSINYYILSVFQAWSKQWEGIFEYLTCVIKNRTTRLASANIYVFI
jgi:hypothetical protein